MHSPFPQRTAEEQVVPELYDIQRTWEMNVSAWTRFTLAPTSSETQYYSRRVGVLSASLPVPTCLSSLSLTCLCCLWISPGLHCSREPSARLYMVLRHSFLEKGKRPLRFRSRKSDSYKVHRAPPRCSLGRGNFLLELIQARQGAPGTLFSFHESSLTLEWTVKLSMLLK